MKIRTLRINAFSLHPFAGNPAVVCFLDDFLEDKILQKIATEMNVSETAFVVPQKNHHFLLRWFSPKVEVQICAHATLASAHAIWAEARSTAQEITFLTKSGEIYAEKKANLIQLNFKEQKLTKLEQYKELEVALGVRSTWIGQAGMRFCVLVENQQVIKELNPHLDALVDLGIRAVSITAAGGPGNDIDFCSRYFAPIVGINEDPVCGSSHLFLAPFWSERLNKTHLHAYQYSSRGGHLYLETLTSEARVKLGGESVTLFSGHLEI